MRTFQRCAVLTQMIGSATVTASELEIHGLTIVRAGHPGVLSPPAEIIR
ncbi:MAG TPA: hypothetical protein PLI09_12145 [Candidatus Hydrogenedentes bacterium]|nr:hypothetical protein [Candidatus Hydrogenedentota bacterium]